MKKLINKQENMIDEMLEGLVKSNCVLLKRVEGKNVVIRNINVNQNNVSLISGGGSGHEPAHAGYVGYGMLSGAVAGEIFTSPTPDQIYTAIKNVPNKNGVLLLIKNYSGDVLNFKLAAEMAKAEGIKIESLIIDDDIALETIETSSGKRGIAGTVLVHKLIGAKAESGARLGEVKSFGELVIKNLASFGIALQGATNLALGKRSFELDETKVEIGLGIHGEPGIYQEDLKTADQYAEMITEKLINFLKIKQGDKIGVLINGLGATSPIELNIVTRKVLKILKQKEIRSLKTFVGNYLTSIDMEGISISFVKLVNKEMEKSLLAKANTVGLKVFENE